MPYQYDWGNGSDDAYQTQLSPGFYRLIATDANGCVKEDTITLLSGSTLVLTIDTLVLSHCITQASTLEMNVAGGVEPYRYFVNGIASNSDFEAWAEDSTLVQVMDANGCSAENGLFLPAFPAPEFVVSGYGSCGNDESYLLVIQPDTTELYRFGFNSEAPTSGRQWQGRPGTYPIHIVRVQDGCAWDTIGEIPFWEPIQVDLQAVSTIRLGDSITLSLFNGTVPSQLVVSWNSSDSMSCINCFDPRVSPVSESVYEYTVIDTLHGCRKSALHLVRVLPSSGLFIPTAFSPDGDGVNDVFWVAGGNSIAEVERMDIFDRTGNLVYSNSHFSANDPTIGWDGNVGGTLAGVGVYVYAIVYRTIDGQVFAQNGDITLVR